MKTLPPSPSGSATGRQYWRSLDQLADTPEFREWAEREFPAGASELTDPFTRRHFVKIMSASFMLAGLGLTGCRRPESKLEPFSQQPEGYVHGMPRYFATSMPTRHGAVPLVAKSYEGRPVKLEGNPLHPDSNGGTDRFAQASILDLYDPDRARRCTHHGNTVSMEEATDALSRLSARFLANKGDGLAFLVEPSSSPSRSRLIALIREKMPEAQWFRYDPTGADVAGKVASTIFGKAVRPRYAYDKAEVILSLDCDFLGSEENLHNNIRGFAQGRRVEKPEDSMNRLYVVESLMSLTGANADHRLRLAGSSIFSLASALAAQVGVDLGSITQGVSGVDGNWIEECANDLVAHRGRCLVVAGAGQPAAVHAFAHAMNAALGNVGKTVSYLDSFEPAMGTIEALAGSLLASAVDTLVMLGGNPAYNAPAQLNWTEAQGKASTVVRLGYHEDETSQRATWNLPLVHFLESWSDARTEDGTLVPVQPLIAPLFGGFTELDVLGWLVGLGAATTSHDIVKETFAGIANVADTEGAWRKYLHDGFLEGSTSKPVNVSLNRERAADVIATAPAAAAGGSRGVEVVFQRDYKVDDGRHNNNGWLQELPDPITKLTWDNVVSVSRKTARDLKVRNGDVVRLTADGRSVEGPIWVQPGQADGVLGLKLGYGRSVVGRVGQGTGFNAYAIRTSDTMSGAVGVGVERTGETYPLSGTQEHWSMEGRPIIREANLEQFREHPDFVKGMNLHEPPAPSWAEQWPAPLYPNPLEKAAQSAHHQWGMSIDLNACVGCSSCVIACQSENNIPIVGKDQVSRGREMHWMRIDRYYVTEAEKARTKDVLQHESHQQFEEWIDDVEVVNQPMLCQHCETAPCESVCPVNATVHDHEGLNVMAYNRCVGTRYCSNNCPYKVRRFNFFDYNKRPLDGLYKGPLAKRPAEEYELVRMIKNPDVSVRMRGVMEKCTFCVQRIESAKIAQKVRAGASGDVVVPDGTIKTACQQSCPAEAIVFGNIADPNSRVSQLKRQQRDYSVLGFLLTKPRTTYLARLRNPNPAMPDYHESPLSLDEYEDKMGDPFQSHGEGQGHEAAGEAGEAHAEKGGH